LNRQREANEKLQKELREQIQTKEQLQEKLQREQQAHEELVSELMREIRELKEQNKQVLLTTVRRPNNFFDLICGILSGCEAARSD
jgi:primosomal protein N'